LHALIYFFFRLLSFLRQLLLVWFYDLSTPDCDKHI
jgi:hypothetical protein